MTSGMTPSQSDPITAAKTSVDVGVAAHVGGDEAGGGAQLGGHGLAGFLVDVGQHDLAARAGHRLQRRLDQGLAVLEAVLGELDNEDGVLGCQTHGREQAHLEVDVVGEAAGESAGNALRWGYTLALPVDGRIWHVQFDDWMFLMDGHTMINKAQMSKFGIRLGEVTLSFTKP